MGAYSKCNLDGVVAWLDTEPKEKQGKKRTFVEVKALNDCCLRHLPHHR